VSKSSRRGPGSFSHRTHTRSFGVAETQQWLPPEATSSGTECSARGWSDEDITLGHLAGLQAAPAQIPPEEPVVTESQNGWGWKGPLWVI